MSVAISWSVEQKKAFDEYWSKLVLEGDPARIPNKFITSFKAGWQAAMKQAAKDFDENSRDIAAEARWHSRQGDDYGSY